MEQAQPSGLFETVRREMRLRNYSHKTSKAYLSHLRSFVHHFLSRHPRDLTNEDIRSYLLYLIQAKKQAASTVNQALNAIRFLYVELYKKPMVLGDIPRPQKDRKLPVVLSAKEVLSILNCTHNMSTGRSYRLFTPRGFVLVRLYD